jgi:hypothetical protein
MSFEGCKVLVTGAGKGRYLLCIHFYFSCKIQYHDNFCGIFLTPYPAGEANIEGRCNILSRYVFGDIDFVFSINFLLNFTEI